MSKVAKTVQYPTSDGKPVAETEIHVEALISLLRLLKRWYAEDPNVYAHGNMLLFYEEGNKRKHVSPDIFVVKGVPKRVRDNYLVWEEGKGPDFIVEITSKTTKKTDIVDKIELYRDTLGVGEYFLFDPRGDYLNPRLIGYRLVDGEYVRIEAIDGRLPSAVTGLLLEPHGHLLNLIDPRTGLKLLSDEEIAEERAKEARQAINKLHEEQAQRRAAEEEIARLKAELERLRGTSG